MQFFSLLHLQRESKASTFQPPSCQLDLWPWINYVISLGQFPHVECQKDNAFSVYLRVVRIKSNHEYKYRIMNRNSICRNRKKCMSDIIQGENISPTFFN